MQKEITINSLSGGKTSSYMAVHYPADYEIFSLVLTDSYECQPKDKNFVKKVSDKIGKDFIATAEHDKTLKVIFDLEQKIGREIIWVAGESFDNLIKRKSIVPNKHKRMCTSELKIKPIFEWWFANIGKPVKMGIGYRFDEMERKENFTTSFKYQKSQNTFGDNRHKWDEIDWRIGYFPMIDDRIFHHMIVQYWRGKGLGFPDDSNCVHCFWKDAMQLRKNFEENPQKMEWASSKETKKTHWKEGITYQQISKINLQLDFFYGTGSGCQAGFCTD